MVMDRMGSSVEQKLAEKMSILNDRGLGMLTRIYNIKKVSQIKFITIQIKNKKIKEREERDNVEAERKLWGGFLSTRRTFIVNRSRR